MRLNGWSLKNSLCRALHAVQIAAQRWKFTNFRTAVFCATSILLTSGAASTEAIGLVQHTSIDAGTSSSATLTFVSNNIAGNWIGVCIRAGAMNETFTVTDSAGNTYRKAFQFSQTTDGDTVALFYAENIASGGNAVTVSETTRTTLRFAILEYSGVATSGSLDVTAMAQGNNASPNSSNAVTTVSGDLLLGVIMTSDPEAYTAGSGYRMEESVPAQPGTKLITEDQTQASAGAVSASATLGAADMWAAGLAAFKAAHSGGVPSPSITSLTPASGTVGTSVTIAGTNFGATQGASTVKFNGTMGTPTSWSATSIVVSVPSGVTTGNVTVTVGGVTSNSVSFDVISGAKIALVQHTSIDAGTSSSATLTFVSNNIAGNWIGVCIRAGAMNETFTVTDSAGNTYRKAFQFSQTTDGDTVALFYAENIASGGNAVTVSETTRTTLRFAILEYSGVATSGSLDVTAMAQGNNASPNSSNAVTTVSGDLLLGVIMTSDPEAYTAGSGYRMEESVPAQPGTKLITEDQTQASAGAVSASATLGAADMWAAGLAAFKAAHSGSPGAAPSANVSATPASVVFTNVPIGVSNTQTIQLRNTTTSSALISGLATQGAGFGTSGLTVPLTLAAGGTSSFNVTFSPTSTGTFNGTLTLSVKGTSSGVVIPLTGSAVAATRLLSASPASLNFGNVAVGEFTTSNISLVNQGNSSLTVQSVSASGQGFSGSGVSSDTIIAPGQTAVLAVEFAPTKTGSATGTIAISSNATNGSTSTIPVTGTGVASTNVIQLSWTASTSAGVAGYNVYRSSVSGGPYTKIVSSPVIGTSYSDQTAQAGVQYYYVATSVEESGIESAYSNQVSALIP